MIFLAFDALLVAGASYESSLFGASGGRLASHALVGGARAPPPEDLEARVQETDSLALVHFEPRLVMKPKRFVDLKHTMRVWDERGDATHRIDGLILQRADAPIHVRNIGRCDLQVEGSVVRRSGRTCFKIRAADAPLGDTLLGRRIEVLSSRIEAATDDDILEYHIEVTDDTIRLFPMRVRPDKTVANGMRVVEATIRDVVEAVQPLELVGR